MNIQNSNKACANCKHWADGWCLVQKMGKSSEHVCNAWKLSLLYDIDRPVLASDKIYYWLDEVPELPKLPEDNAGKESEK